MRYAVIMAGGAGKRLWPMSRQNRPKQLLPFIDGKTLLNIAVERLNGLFDDDKILIVTNDEYADQVAAAVPQVPAENVIGEPQGRDTAAAIALGAELLAARDDDATMAVFTADHVIRPLEDFGRCVGLTCEWLDVGHWPALADVLDGDDSGNVIVSDNAVVMDCNRNIIVSEDDHLLAVVGMDDCIVVHAADATLVCNKADSQRLKELVNVLKKEHGDRYT